MPRDNRPGGEGPEEHLERIRQSYGLPPKGQPVDQAEEAVEVTPEPVKPEPKPERRPPAWFTTDPAELRQVVSEEAQRLGVDGMRDPEILALATGRTWTSEADYFREVGHLLERRAIKQEKQSTITLGAAVSEAATAPTIASTEELAAELARIQNGPDPTSPKNAARRKEIREQLRRAE